MKPLGHKKLPSVGEYEKNYYLFLESTIDSQALDRRTYKFFFTGKCRQFIYNLLSVLNLFFSATEFLFVPKFVQNILKVKSFVLFSSVVFFYIFSPFQHNYLLCQTNLLFFFLLLFLNVHTSNVFIFYFWNFHTFLKNFLFCFHFFFSSFPYGKVEKGKLCHRF